MPELLGGIVDRAQTRLMRQFPTTRLRIAPQRPLVTFTFDDVPDTALSAGAAILERHGVRGTFYIASGLFDRTEPDRRLISAAGVAELSARGHEIGCHTYAHDKVRTLSPSELRADLDRNQATLDGLAARSARRNFAYPYNAPSLAARGEMGRRFRSQRGAGEAINRDWIDTGFLASVEIRQPEAHARGLTRWIDDVAAMPGWLIFFTHDICDEPTPYGCTPASLEALVAHAVARGCEIVTVDHALDRLGAPV